MNHDVGSSANAATAIMLQSRIGEGKYVSSVIQSKFFYDPSLIGPGIAAGMQVFLQLLLEVRCP